MEEFIPFFAIPPSENSDSGSASAKEKREFIPMSAPTSASAAPPPSAAAHPHHPVVKLLREGDRVKQIRIQCSCGQVIELDCLY